MKQFDRLVEIGKIGGRSEVLRDLRDWIDAQLETAAAQVDKIFEEESAKQDITQPVAAPPAKPAAKEKR